MFARETRKGVLTVQNVKHRDASIGCVNGSIEIASEALVQKIPADLVRDLKMDGDSLSFSYEDKKYRFEGSNLQEIYDKMQPLTADSSMFGTDKVQYYTYNTERRTFDLYESKVELKLFRDVNYYLKIEDRDSVVHLEEISTSTQYYMDQNTSSFVWSIFLEGSFHTFSIKFEERLEFLEFLAKYVESSYKSVNKDSGEHSYFENMVKISDRSDETEEDGQQAEWDEYEDEEPAENDFNKHSSSNEHLVMGDGRVYVTRGTSLGVFDVSQDDLTFRTHIQNALSNPQKIITHNADQNLLVLDKDQKDCLQLLDLNKGEVVEKWKIGDMNDYFDSIKYQNTNTLVGISDTSLFRIDPRVKDKVVERNEYKTKNEFSCGIATQTGDVAVASRKGDLRLYNKIDKRAKSLLPGFGDEVIGIDTSKDGSVVLCTCRNYILVFSVGANYAKAMGKDKPAPKRLQLKPQHLSFVREDVSFTPAKFDQDDGVIITSTGRYVVKWKVQDVLSGDVYSYSLRALYDKIVDENFVSNGRDIVVALPNDVKKVTEDELRRPRH